MTYPVTKLIADAFYTSGIVSRQFQTVAGDQEQTAFDKLNEILSDTAIEEDMIPYFNTAYNVSAVAGQEMYFIPNLAEPETLTFFINTIRYQMRKNPRDQYFGSGRAQNVLSLPFNWHTERTFGGHNLFMYFFPDKNYPLQLTGLFRLQNVTLNQDLGSSVTTVNLGVVTVTGTGTFGFGQLVVNNVDLAGTYATAAALVAFINTGVIPYVSAVLSSSGELILTNRTSSNISLATAGSEGNVNNVTFSNFSTVNGPLQQSFQSVALDQYYINYLQYRLADRLCTAYNFVPPPGMQKQLLQYMQMISKRSSPIDMSMNKLSTLTNQTAINYGQVNLGKGWSVL